MSERNGMLGFVNNMQFSSEHFKDESVFVNPLESFSVDTIAAVASFGVATDGTVWVNGSDWTGIVMTLVKAINRSTPWLWRVYGGGDAV